MPMFDGMDEDTGRDIGPMEQTVREFTHGYGRGDDPYRQVIMAGMESLARNIDSQTKRGREISRNMSALLDCVKELRQMDAESMAPEDDEATARLLEAMRL
ncbi:hypothetical protein [Bifidobacterium phasiani]|uniref:Uncharacterized protein n=1 Tax=Bifidobacterium phasiani TaxID=2834431 RepID=A0ABS6WBA0_9BIFI|nr:hypothetical protein [Bifidobacterium phasiani]MBW3083799.1 hypothetical protein [Bifidobacterium phasiani]